MNPKCRIGQSKVSVSLVPVEVILEVAAAIHEGALKYGKYNWRKQPVNGTVYTDAAFRHIASWMVGEDIDPDSDLHHITKAIASLVILRDAIIQGTHNDTRPEGGVQLQPELNARIVKLLDKHCPSDPEPVEQSAVSAHSELIESLAGRIVDQIVDQVFGTPAAPSGFKFAPSEGNCWYRVYKDGEWGDEELGVPEEGEIFVVEDESFQVPPPEGYRPVDRQNEDFVTLSEAGMLYADRHNGVSSSWRETKNAHFNDFFRTCSYCVPEDVPCSQDL